MALETVGETQGKMR